MNSFSCLPLVKMYPLCFNSASYFARYRSIVEVSISKKLATISFVKRNSPSNGKAGLNDHLLTILIDQTTNVDINGVRWSGPSGKDWLKRAFYLARCGMQDILHPGSCILHPGSRPPLHQNLLERIPVCEGNNLIFILPVEIHEIYDPVLPGE